MAKGVSEIAGEADGPGGSVVTVYRALKQLLCAPCGEPIEAGTLFTRRGVPGHGLRSIPQCGKCAPFKPRKVDAEGRRPSPLLASLLTPRAEDRPCEEVRPAHGSTMDAVERRLGPALRRCRRREKP